MRTGCLSQSSLSRATQQQVAHSYIQVYAYGNSNITDTQTKKLAAHFQYGTKYPSTKFKLVDAYASSVALNPFALVFTMATSSAGDGGGGLSHTGDTLEQLDLRICRWLWLWLRGHADLWVSWHVEIFSRSLWKFGLAVVNEVGRLATGTTWRRWCW